MIVLRPYSIIEGTKECLARLQMDYVDIIFAHRPDPTGESRIRVLTRHLTSFVCSAYGRSCPCIQPCYSHRLGTILKRTLMKAG